MTASDGLSPRVNVDQTLEIAPKGLEIGEGKDVQCKIEEVASNPRNHTTSRIMEKLRGVFESDVCSCSGCVAERHRDR